VVTANQILSQISTNRSHPNNFLYALNKFYVRWRLDIRSGDKVEIDSSFWWELIPSMMPSLDTPLDDQYLGLALLGDEVDALLLLDVLEFVDVVAYRHVPVDKLAE
jgi:hypothetical protein